MTDELPDSVDAGSDELPAESIEAYFVAQLRNLRQARKLSQAGLGKLMNYWDGQIGMVEGGHRRATLDFAKRCDRFFDTVKVFTDLIPMMGRDSMSSWYRAYKALEAQASAIQICEIQVVPGLFQTPDYARAVFLTNWPLPPEHVMKDWLDARLERQAILDQDKPPVITGIIDESVLRRPVGGPGIMANQLDRLIELAKRPNVRVHVLTFKQSARCHLDGPFTLLELPSGRCVAYVSALNGGMRLVDRRIVDGYGKRLRSILGEALSWLDSIAFLERLKRELYEHE